MVERVVLNHDFGYSDYMDSIFNIVRVFSALEDQFGCKMFIRSDANNFTVGVSDCDDNVIKSLLDGLDSISNASLDAQYLYSNLYRVGSGATKLYFYNGAESRIYEVISLTENCPDEESLKFCGTELISEVDVKGMSFYVTIDNLSDTVVKCVLDGLLITKENLSCEVCSEGAILLDESERGRIYINGIYSSTDNRFSYGWNVRDFSSNVYMVLSTLVKEGKISVAKIKESKEYYSLWEGIKDGEKKKTVN